MDDGDISFMGKVIAYDLGMKLERSPLKAEKFVKDLFTKREDVKFLHQTMKHSKEQFLEIISYWISEEQLDESTLVEKLNDFLRNNHLNNSCITYEKHENSIKISMVNEDIFDGKIFKDFKDETTLCPENREKIYKLMEKRCLRQARYIGHFLLPYGTVSDIYYRHSTPDSQWQGILEEIRENYNPSWSCLKELFYFIGNKTIVESIERDILKVESNPQGNSTPVSYPMQNSPHGYCVIINNSFKGTAMERNGTMKDEERLRETFQSLDFTVETHTDKKADEMKEIFKSYADINHESYDCFVCVILSHGCEGHVCGNDNEKIKITEIRDMFGGNMCDSLIGKPKLFFIQACQGENVNSIYDSTLSSDGPPNGNSTSNSNGTLPNICDFLIFMSSVSGTVSWRESERGSWFIQTLCETLRNNSSRSLNDNIHKINDKVSQLEGVVDQQLVKQISNVIGDTLRAPIFLKLKQ